MTKALWSSKIPSLKFAIAELLHAMQCRVESRVESLVEYRVESRGNGALNGTFHVTLDLAYQTKT